MDERYSTKEFVRENFTQRLIPKKLSWFGCLGGLSLMAFCLQVGSGIFLMCFYVPSASEAFSSIQYIKHGVTLGWLVHKLHLVGAQVMVGCILGHMIRILFKGIYKKPRELHWVSGSSLFLLTLLTAYAGTQLTAEGLYTWNVKTDGKTLNSPSMINKYEVGKTQEGKRFSNHRLPFLYAMHVALIPLVMVLFMSFHFAMVRRTGISEPL